MIYSTLGGDIFHPWGWYIPPLGMISSTLGDGIFHPWGWYIPPLGVIESLEFHRKYNYSSTGPPKYLILVEFTKESLNPTISGRIALKISKMQNIWFLMIRAGSGDSCEDLPLLNLCNWLCFIRPGQVFRGQWARRGISVISKKLIEITGNLLLQ